MSASTPDADLPAPADDPLGRTLMRVAWLSILLGILIQLVLLAAGLAQGAQPSWVGQLADTAKSVSWATLVCVGVAVGRAIPGARAVNMGLMGLLSGPLAFNMAKVVHRGVGESLKVAPSTAAAIALPAATMGLIKALEYGALSALVAWVSRQRWGRLGAHVGTGLAVGLVFGGLVYLLTNRLSLDVAGQALPMAKALPIFINETVFPMGCAVVLYSTDSIRRRLG